MSTRYVWEKWNREIKEILGTVGYGGISNDDYDGWSTCTVRYSDTCTNGRGSTTGGTSGVSGGTYIGTLELTGDITEIHGYEAGGMSIPANKYVEIVDASGATTGVYKTHSIVKMEYRSSAALGRYLYISPVRGVVNDYVKGLP